MVPNVHLAEESLESPDHSNAEDGMLTERVKSLRLPESAENGYSHGGGWFTKLLCFALACSTGWLAYEHYWKSPKNIPAPAQATASKPATTPVAGSDKAPATSLPITPTAPSGGFALEAKGYIIPTHQILVSPKVGGMVTKLRIIESQRVQKNEILAELEDTEYIADRNRAKALLASAKHNLEELTRGYRPEEVEQARAELAEAEAQSVQLEADYRRAVEMLSRKVISRETYDSTQSRYQAMERRIDRLQLALKLMEEGPRIERIDVAKAQVEQAEAELAKAEWRLSNTVIRAPISGTILKKNAEEGSLVNPGAMQGFFSLCEMADLSDLEVDLTIQERDISKISVGQKCELNAEAYPTRTYKGEVSRIMPMADRAKGSISVRVKIDVPADEEGVYLKPEMGAMVRFLNK